MRPRSSARAFALAALCPLAAVACSLVSLGGIALASHPSARGEVIAVDEPLSVEFSVPVEHRSAERLLRVSTADGACGGDLAWDGNRLSFTPVPPLPRGRRLLLSFSGDLAAADGRTFAVSLEVPFFVGTDERPPRLASAAPGDGEAIGTRDPLCFRFTAAIDQDTFGRAFTLSPGAEYTTAWDADGAAVTVSPREAWETLTAYRWRIGTDLEALSGVRLGCEEAGCFVVQLDPVGPCVLGLQPAELGEGTFHPLGGGLDGLRARDCILMSFSEPVSLETLEAAFSVEPSVAGRILAAGDAQYAFVPEQSWHMSTTHHLRISSEVEDLAGNHAAVEHEEWFVPAIAEQRITGITLDGLAVGAFCAPDPVEHALAAPGEITVAWDFAEVYSVQEQPLVQASLRLDAYFPDSLPDPALVSAAWDPSGRRVTLVYEGLSAGTGTSPHYYRLFAPGGADGIPNADGSWLAEDAWVVIVVAP